MIPDELIDKAAQAIIMDASPGILLTEMHPEDLANVRTDARIAIETVAAAIWDEGWKAGIEYMPGYIHSLRDMDEPVPRPTTNPYRASETA